MVLTDLIFEARARFSEAVYRLTLDRGAWILNTVGSWFAPLPQGGRVNW